MNNLCKRLQLAGYYGIVSSTRLSGPAIIALHTLGAMVHGTSGRLRKAAVRAFSGMRLRRRTKSIEVEYEVESASEELYRSSTSVSEAVSLEEDCVSSGRCEPVSYGCGTDPWAREKTLLYFAAGFLLLGHWHHLLWALSNLSLSQLSSIAAVACASAALWRYLAAHRKGWTMRAQETWYQLACLVKTVLASVLKLPEVSRNIKLALVELQEVDYTLKNIHAKIKFLPGHVAQETCLHAYTSELQALREAELQQARQH